MPGRAFPIWAWVAGGSAFGGILRHVAGLMAAPPWPTLAVNVAGSFAIAIYWALTGPDGRVLVAPRYRFAVMAGLCGGLTTFSMFGIEFWSMMLEGARGAAGAYLLVSAALWLLAAAAGMFTGKWINGAGR